MNKAEGIFAPRIVRALDSQFDTLAAYVQRVGPQEAEQHLTAVPLSRDIGAIIRQLYVSVAKVNANFIYGLLQDSLRKHKDFTPAVMKRTSFGLNERWEQIVNEYFSRFLLDKAVVPISDTSKQLVLDMITEGIREGLGAEEIAMRIRSVDVNSKRARLITRTETTRATNFAGMAAAYETGYETQKQWIEVKDNRTRQTHRHGTGVGGELRDLDQPYGNGLFFPGDPNGGAKEVCNCRCCQGFVPKRDRNGRLIPIRQMAGPNASQSIVDALALNSVTTIIANLATLFINDNTPES